MADESSAADETPITFNIKSSSDAKYVLTLPLSITVADLKQKLSTSEYADIPPERQRLIYSGRVLKDPDTLASYKIKEGNTVHLVKGAASNQRQNPANQGSSTTTGAGAGGAAPSGVPQNLAAGTGRDPLTALTGARYAGFAQMPNANMFGPDGGMGPPPDPEHMASMLENPNFASTLSEALSNPDVIEQMIRSNPMFQGPMGQQARQMLQDPNFRRMMTDPATLRQMSEMRRSMPGMFGGLGGMGMGGMGGGDGSFPMPGATDNTPATAEGERTNTTTQGGQGGNNNANQAAPNPFALFGQMPAGGAGGAGANPFAALFNPQAGANLPGGGAAAPAGQQTMTNNNTTSAGDSNNPPETREGDTQQQQPQPAPANPFAAMTQQLMQNPQMMQQILSSMSAFPQPSSSASPTPSNPANPPNPTTNTNTNMNNPPDQLNPFAALANLQNLYGGGGGLDGNPFAAFGGGGGAGGAGLGQQAPQAPADTRPPEDRYAEQLRQLNEMGFYEFERNVEALRRTGGSIQGAVEYLLTH